MTGEERDRLLMLLRKMSAGELLELFADYNGARLIDDGFRRYAVEHDRLPLLCERCGDVIDKQDYEEALRPTCSVCGKIVCPACVSIDDNYGEVCRDCAYELEAERAERRPANA